MKDVFRMNKNASLLIYPTKHKCKPVESTCQLKKNASMSVSCKVLSSLARFPSSLRLSFCWLREVWCIRKCANYLQSLKLKAIREKKVLINTKETTISINFVMQCYQFTIITTVYIVSSEISMLYIIWNFLH